MPGANLFIAGADLTTPPSSSGDRLIQCEPISGAHGGSLAAKGIRILTRLGGELGL